ncbi:hypothetical protein NC652_009871 [Populus alba x Populus x berolinensis]|nr:hypothetical protein NC652_009871 [Populus alba x Populus x berolinensis]
MMGNHLHYMNTQYAADSAVGFAAYPNSYTKGPLLTIIRGAVTGVATPMTHRCGAQAPLVPRLCNACGIKYRKEEEKRRAREAAKRTNGIWNV